MGTYDKPKHNCGIVGVYSHTQNALDLALSGLVSLQHRGQEGAGIAIADGNHIRSYKNAGYISAVFQPDIIRDLNHGHIAIAHTRYSTAGSLDALQPFVEQDFALAHNGNLINVQGFSADLAVDSIISDSWAAHQLILNQPYKHIEEKMRHALPKIRGAYSFVALTKDALYLIRDPWGFRPLVLGRLPDGGWVAASETCALELMDAAFVREVLPGEGIVINKQGVGTFYFDSRGPLSRCVFEFIYVARPDSKIFGKEVHTVRKRCGEILFREQPVEADVIISIPHSGDSATRGFHEASKIPLVEGVFANRYVGRAFIEPVARRKHTAKLKYGVIDSDIRGKRVCAVDDSIVRGDASANFIKLLREHGAREVHLRIAAPPLKFPCYFGVDFASPEELIAHRYESVQHITKAIGADSLAYLSTTGLIEAVSGIPLVLNGSFEKIFQKSGFCGACFTGEYPVQSEGMIHKEDINVNINQYLIVAA